MFGSSHVCTDLLVITVGRYTFFSIWRAYACGRTRVCDLFLPAISQKAMRLTVFSINRLKH